MEQQKDVEFSLREDCDTQESSNTEFAEQSSIEATNQERQDESETSTITGDNYHFVNEEQDCSRSVLKRCEQELAKRYGFEEPTVAQLRAAILNEYRSSGRFTLGRCRQHLHFLFLTHNERPTDEDLRDMAVVDKQFRLVKPHYRHIHLPGSPAERLLNEQSDESADLTTLFVHPAFLEDVPPRPSSTHPSWQRWLHDSVGVQEHIQLLSSDGHNLSSELLFIAKNHPGKVLQTLADCWPTQGSAVIKSPSAKQAMSRLSASCQSGEVYPLWETYLPVKSVTDYCGRFLGHYDAFPVLDLGQTSEEDLAGRWGFLKTDLGVTATPTLSFMLDILGHIFTSNPDGMTLASSLQVYGLYRDIEKQCSSSLVPQAMRDAVRSYLEDTGCVLVPDHGASVGLWAYPHECVWDSPVVLKTRYNVKIALESLPHYSAEEASVLLDFFSKTVAVPILTISDLVTELCVLKDEDEAAGDVEKVYTCISDLASTEDAKYLRQAFADDALIMCRDGTSSRWFKSSSCRWSTDINLEDACMVNRTYPALKKLFVDLLGIEGPTAVTLYELMCKIGSSKPSNIPELKRALSAFNTMLHQGTTMLPSNPAAEDRIFPVRQVDGTITAMSVSEDFAVANHGGLADRFQGKIKLLDFSVEEVFQLRPTLEWAGLDSKYLTSMVRETTQVSSSATFPLSSPKRELKKKAHALLRIAAASHSPRYADDGRELYDQLRNTEIVETNGISSTHTIIQDGVPCTVPGFDCEGHIKDGPPGLTVYVPHSPDAQDVCFSTSLPVRLATWLMQDPGTGSVGPFSQALPAVLSSLLPCPAAVSDRVLEQHGIPQIEIRNEDSTQRLLHVPNGNVGSLPTPYEADLVPKWNLPPTPGSSHISHLPNVLEDITMKQGWRPDYFALKAKVGEMSPVNGPASVLSDGP